jgi:hypothetical protein
MATDLTGGLPAEREFVLVEVPEQDGTRDACNVWIEEENGAFAMRIGVEAASPDWNKQSVWLDIAFPNGRLLSYRAEGDAVHDPIDDKGRPAIRGAGPARFHCVEPFKLWNGTFMGQAPQITAQDLIDNKSPQERNFTPVECNLELIMAVPPWVPGALLPEAAKALGGEQGDMMSPRFEQLCRVKGELRIGSDSRNFKGQGLRIRRTGYRQFTGFWGHCWQSALFPSGKGFGFNIYPPRDDGEPSYAEGYIFEGDGKLIPARPVEVPWLRKLVTSGESVPFVLETVDGRRISIDGTTFANIRSRGHSVMPPDFPIVQQAHATYGWDGETATGMIERSSKPSVMDL